MLDNIGMDNLGRILMQEDPGNQAHLAKVWLYGTDTKELIQVAQFDPALFTPGEPGFITQDEESSGVVDASSELGRGMFLLDAQVHKRFAAEPELSELREPGQLLAMYVDPRLGVHRGHRD